MALQKSVYRTGVTGLDEVLGGGLTPNDLALIIGAPGAGKTVLGSQIIFNAVRRGLPALICTSYSEGHVKLLEHMQGFDFFDATAVGDRLKLLSLQNLIDVEPESPASQLIRTIRESGAQIVLIDGFQGAAPSGLNSHFIRQMFSGLASALPYINARVLVTIAGNARDPLHYAETTAADTVISLEYALANGQHLRQIDVVKQRGLSQLPGQHYYQIDSTGISVIPRLEIYPTPASRPRPTGRTTFGLPELDKLLGGGPNAGTTTILAGAPGTGKTTLSLHWAIQDARPDASTFFLTFGEFPEQLSEKARAFGVALAAAEESKALQVMRISPARVNPDLLADVLRNALLGANVQRLVIDGISILIDSLGSRAMGYISALSDHLYGEGISSLFVTEIDPFIGLKVSLKGTPLSVIGENLVILQQQEAAGELRRILAVLRMRRSDYDRTLRELVFDSGGIRVLSPAETGIDVLSEIASASGGVTPDSEKNS